MLIGRIRPLGGLRPLGGRGLTSALPSGSSLGGEGPFDFVQPFREFNFGAVIDMEELPELCSDELNDSRERAMRKYWVDASEHSK